MQTGLLECSPSIRLLNHCCNEPPYDSAAHGHPSMRCCSKNLSSTLAARKFSLFISDACAYQAINHHPSLPVTASNHGQEAFEMLTRRCGGGQGCSVLAIHTILYLHVRGRGGGVLEHTVQSSPLGDKVIFIQINKATISLFDALISHSNSNASHGEVIRYTHGLLATSNSTQ